jgi:uncharacterized protein YceH (UPF0502 family)
VVRLAREPGRRDSRYAHLFSGPVAAGTDEEHGRPSDTAHAGGTSHSVDAVYAAGAAHATASSGSSGSATPRSTEPSAARIDRLEAEVQQLRAELNDLKQRLGG